MWPKFLKYMAVDALAVCIALCVFAYFHHVRMLWNLGGNHGSQVVDVVQKPQPPLTEQPFTSQLSGDKTDVVILQEDQGQFGERFADQFAATEDEYISTADEYKSRDVHITLTRSEQNVEGKSIKYYIYDIYVRNIENLFCDYSMTERRLFTDWLQDVPTAVAAVSGDYCGNSNSAYVVVRNGLVLRKSETVRYDLCVLGWDGRMTIMDADEYSYEKLIELSPYQAWCFGPILVKDGKAMTYFNHRRDIAGWNPRVAIGCVEPGHYVFLLVDGGAGGNNGMKLGMTAKILKEHGCQNAYNLDGGASAHGSFNGQILRNGHPGAGTPRAIYDIVCVGEVE